MNKCVNISVHEKNSRVSVVYKGKGKSVPLQALSGPEGPRKLKLPDFVTTELGGGKFVSLMYRPHLTPGNHLGSHFC